MQILHRYIFRRAVGATLLVVTTCSVIASLINLFDILDDVVKQNVTYQVLVQYLLTNMVPRMLDIISVMMVLAGLFTMGELNRRLELTSMRAAGLNDRTLMIPIGYMALVLFGIVLILEVSTISELTKKGDELKSYIKSGRMKDVYGNPFYARLLEASLSASRYEREKETIYGVTVNVYKEGRVSQVMQSEEIKKVEGSWFIISGYNRKIDPTSGQVIQYETNKQMKYPVELPVPEMFLQEVLRSQEEIQWMSLGQLIERKSFIARQEIHKKIAIATTTAVSLILGGWIGMKIHRFNAARAICLAMLIGFGHRLVSDGFLAAGMEFGASWVCHLANLVMVIVLVIIPFLTAV